MPNLDEIVYELYRKLTGNRIPNDPDMILLKATLQAWGEQVLIEFTEKYVQDHPEDYDGPCLCGECWSSAPLSCDTLYAIGFATQS